MIQLINIVLLIPFSIESKFAKENYYQLYPIKNVTF